MEHELPDRLLKRINKFYGLEKFQAWMTSSPFGHLSGGSTRWESVLRLDFWLSELVGPDSSMQLLFRILDVQEEQDFDATLERLKKADDFSLHKVRKAFMPETVKDSFLEGVIEVMTHFLKD